MTSKHAHNPYNDIHSGGYWIHTYIRLFNINVCIRTMRTHTDGTYNSLNRTQTKSSTQFRKPVYTCRNIFEITFKEQKATYTHIYAHTFIYLLIYKRKRISFLPLMLVVVTAKDHEKSSIWNVSQDSPIYTKVLHLSRVSFNPAQFNRQQYLFPLSQAVTGFCKVLLNIQYVGLLKTKKMCLISHGITNTFYTEICYYVKFVQISSLYSV